MEGSRNNYRGEWGGLWNRIARYISGMGYTRNIGTITGILMNGVSKGNAGNIDLGNVQEKIDADHKLSADLIEDGENNKVINVKPDWNAASGAVDEIRNKPTLATVATSGSYNDLSNKPTIPDVSDMEVTTNKVTSLSSSSTHTQYPSAKCVYDLVGDIETLLAAI